MKHKTLAVLCAVVLTAGMMTGCGQKTEDTKTESGSEKTVSDEMAEKRDSATVPVRKLLIKRKLPMQRIQKRQFLIPVKS